MPVQADFSVPRYNSFSFTVSLAPPVAIGGWGISFQVQKRFGGISGLITKSVSSGFNNSSGINITNSGLGIFTISIQGVDTSGLEYGNYAYAVDRTDTRTTLSEGYMIVTPGIGG